MARDRRPARTPNYTDYCRHVDALIAKGEQKSVADIAGELKMGMLQAFAFSARYARDHEEEPEYHQKPSRIKQRRKKPKK